MAPPAVDEQVDVDRLEELYREQGSDRPIDLGDAVLGEPDAHWYVQGRIDEYIDQNAVTDGDVAEAKRRAGVES